MGNPNAQIAYHFDVGRNINQYWHMPSNCYSFNVNVSGSQANGPSFEINFHALDTNGKRGLLLYRNNKE